MLRKGVTLTALLGGAGLAAAIGLGTSNMASAAAAGPQTIVDAAYKAMGMTDVKLAEAEVVALVIRGNLQAWDPGESESVADPTKPDWGMSTFTETWDRSRNLYRMDWVRPRANGGMRTYTEIFTDEYGPTMGGYVSGIDVNGGQPARAVMGPNNQPLHTMSGLRLTAELRELERDNVIDEAHDHPDRVFEAPNQRAGGKSYPTVQYRGEYGSFYILFDPQSHLPEIVRTRDWEVHDGDTDYDMALSDWRDIGKGVKMPFHRVVTANGQKIFDIKIDNVRFNPQLAVDTYTVPAALRGKAAAPAPIGKVPFQWVLRRMGNGFYLDSDALYTDDGQQLRLVDLAPNTSMVQGGSHNTLIVATNNYLVVFDAPGDDGMSNKVLDMAAQKYPGKPVKYVVLTHHHIDHTGGVRAFVAQGATLVVGKGDGAFWRKALSYPANLNLYPIKGKVEPRVTEVTDKWSVNDGGREVDAFVLENPHATGYLIPYVPDAKLGWVTDLWNPGAPVTMSNPVLVAVVNGVDKMGIKPERFAGGHGAVGNYADVEKVVKGR